MKAAIVLFAALVLVLGTHVLDRADAAPAEVKWEFKMVASTGNTGMDDVNAAGKEGWELVAVQDGYWYLKRPLK